MIKGLKGLTFLGNATPSSFLKGKGGRGRAQKTLVAALMLTSLVDAFSILVIYLLMSFSTTGQILYVDKDIELPLASQTSFLEHSTVVKVHNGGDYFIENEKVSSSELVEKLIAARDARANKANGITNKAHKNGSHSSQKPSNGETPHAIRAIIIQADKKVKYRFLNNVILAASHAGFEEIRFAVLSN